MRRYLDPAGTKFWEIERDGRTITRVSGKVGTKGRKQARDFTSALHARFHEKSFTGYKTWTEKYTLESSTITPRIELPADDDERLVLADVLQQRGEPLGELITMHQAGVDAAPFLATHPQLLGDIADARDLFELEWHLGAIRRAKIGHDVETQAQGQWMHLAHRLMPDVPTIYLFSTLVRALFDLDVARRLEDLELGSANASDYQDTMLAIVEDAPHTLRRLAIHGNARRYRWDIAIAAMSFPALESFACDLGLSIQSLEFVASAVWPKLRELTFTIPEAHEQEPARDPREAIAALAPLFAATGVPDLREVNIWTPAPNELGRALAGSPLAKQAEITFRSMRPIDRAVEATLPANVRYVQMPIGTMRGLY